MDIPTDKDKLNIQEIILFKNRPTLAYIYKKTEKLVSALYMLSNFISDKEPIKWQMREEGVELLSRSLSFITDQGRSLANLNSFISAALKFLSFLEVSYVGGVISEMNYRILKTEFESLIQAVESAEKKDNQNSLIFPEHFFEISNGQQISKLEDENTSKGQNIMSDRMSIKKEPTKQKDKSNRQEIIMSLLKKNKELGIKDFVSSISDCSEKTIQRELVVLVAKGLIRKEGEKRWSRYSIK